MVPVEGVRPRDVPDSWNAKRSGDRVHRAIDIAAKKGTPVVSTDDGTIFKLRDNASGGRTLYVTEPGGRFIYYYAHLDRYREGLREGDRVRKGEVIAYVGTTGNAPKNHPHLHFQLLRLEDAKRWWAGASIDARPLFAEEGKAVKARPAS